MGGECRGVTGAKNYIGPFSHGKHLTYCGVAVMIK